MSFLEVDYICTSISPDKTKPISYRDLDRLLGWSNDTIKAHAIGNPEPIEDPLPCIVTPLMARTTLLRLERALAVMGELIVQEDKLKFFDTPHPLMNNERPAQLLKSDEGLEKIIQNFEGMATGSFA